VYLLLENLSLIWHLYCLEGKLGVCVLNDAVNIVRSLT